jgi:hypothetical protein
MLDAGKREAATTPLRERPIPDHVSLLLRKSHVQDNEKRPGPKALDP